ncbi:MAG: hypothetical protein JSV84_08990 [Gemmatimonadota bacterium]|nr:MAG: hypothetical protein JSV84_08990 [Gemmatimonadota bacterium]
MNTEKKTNIVLSMVIAFSVGASSSSCARWHFDIETGVVLPGYNDVRIPNETGTLFSLTEELETDPKPFFRTKVTYPINDRHSLTILAAPLRLHAEGQANRPVKFEEEEFPANTSLTAKYRFDSYRLTYRYDFHRSENLQSGIGFTAKIRDASISLEGDDKKAEKKNTGFVPLINFRLHWTFAKKLSLVLDGDALAAPQGQGRAEDVLLAVQYNMNKNIDLKLGYRILEGGADVDEVYNFTLIHYLVFGAVVSL